MLLDAQRIGRQFVILGLGQKPVQPATMVNRAQCRGRDPQLERLARTSEISVTSFRLGKNRRLDLLLAWLTLWPDIGPLPESSQTRDIALIPW